MYFRLYMGSIYLVSLVDVFFQDNEKKKQILGQNSVNFFKYLIKGTKQVILLPYW